MSTTKKKLILIIHMIGLLPYPEKILVNFNNRIANECSKCMLNEVNELKLAMDAFHIARSTRITKGK
jgi:hypothetical protein